jgi:crotonobetainyl-CoA:carnitine CoA-transferase CaiB-like acyl-CoA transferase
VLSSYRVLDLTDERGHFAGFLLAALGAEVIAVEPPSGMRARRLSPFVADQRGPERSLTHFAYNRGKRSVVLDLREPADRQRFLGLVGGADVLLDSAAPGHFDALGLGHDVLAGVNPTLVHTSVTAFGGDGPKACWPATDLTVLASSGSLVLNGDADRPPVRLVVPQAFAMASAVATCATLVALAERASSGRGQHVVVSAQTAAMLAAQVSVVTDAVGVPTVRRSAGGARTGAMGIQFVYPAADGHVSITHVFGPAIGPRTADLMAWACEEGHCDEDLRDRDWVQFGNFVERGLESVETWEAAKAAVADLTRSHTKSELFEEAQRRRLLMAPVAEMDDVTASVQLRHRGFFDRVVHPELGREVDVPGAFAKFSRRPLVPLGPAPGLGEHTAEVLAEPARQPSTGDPAGDSTSIRRDADPAGDSASIRRDADPAGDSTSIRRDAEPAAAVLTPRAGGATATGAGRALSGLKILDFTWSIAGPHGTRVLADCGATVVKIESKTKPDASRGYRPTYGNEPGPENSALFDTMNAGKLSLQLDLNHPDSRDVVLDLVRWADAVVESFSPRAMRGWRLDYEHLRAVKPGIVMVSTCLTGQDGPLASFAGYGNLAAALSGFQGLAGWPDRPPAGPFGAYTDYTSTHLVLAALLAALDHRRRTGEGQHVDVAQAEAALHYLSPAVLEYTVNGRVAARAGNTDPDMAPHGVYPAAGPDHWVAIACQDDAAWPALCHTIGRGDLAADASLASVAGRLARREELDEAVAAWTRPLHAEKIEALLVEAGVAAHAVNNSAECLADPQLHHLGHFVEVDHPDRRCLVESTRFRLSRTPPAVGLPPRSGQHTDHVLCDLLGYSPDRVDTLRQAGALR